MVKLVFRSSVGAPDVLVDVPPSGSLMQAAVRGKVPGVEAACGGSMVCGTCHVYVDDAWIDRLPAQSDAEREILEFSIDPQPNSRLACQIAVTEALDGLCVTTPASQR